MIQQFAGCTVYASHGRSSGLAFFAIYTLLGTGTDRKDAILPFPDDCPVLRTLKSLFGLNYGVRGGMGLNNDS